MRQKSRRPRSADSKSSKGSQGTPIFTEFDPATLPALLASEENLGASAPDSVRSPASAPASAPVNEGASLKSRVGGGVRWSALGSLVIQLLSLARSAALTRLLLQSDFGLMGMASSLTGALGVLTATGMGGSIVAGQFKDEAQMHRHLNTVWTVEVIRGAILTLLLCGATPLVGRFYGEARLTSMLPVLALTPFIGSLGNIGLSLLTRGVEIRRTTQFALLSNIAVLGITLGLALWWRNVWALVWGQVAGSLIATGLSYFYHPFRPRFEIDREALKTAFSFGKWMFIIGVMVYITTTVDNVFVGKLLGAKALGPYVAAYSIANLPASLVAQIFSSVFLPTFAELGRGDTSRLEAIVERVFQIGAALLMLVSLPFVLFADEVVNALFGARWAEAAAPLRILVAVGLFRGFIQMVTPLAVGLNKPEIEGKSKIAEAIIFLALIYPMTVNFGTLGAAWTGVIVYAFALVTRYRGAWHLAPRAFAKLPLIVARLLGAVALGAAAGEAARGALRGLGWSNNWIILIGAGGVTMATTTILMMVVSPALRAQLAPVTSKIARVFKRQ